jgi:hypothetical protein
MPKFVDDKQVPVEAVTAEQHALDNPSHTVKVVYRVPIIRNDVEQRPGTLTLDCENCGWWDEQLY